MEAATQQQEMKKCPACAEFVLADAKKCKHCGTRLVAWKPTRAQKTIVVAAVVLAVIAPFAPGLFWPVAMKHAFHSAISDGQRCCEEAVKKNIPSPHTGTVFAFCGMDANYAREDFATALEGKKFASDGRYVAEYGEVYAAHEYAGARKLVFDYFNKEWRGRYEKVQGTENYKLWDPMINVAAGINKCR